jgi:hypothetical protein
MSSPVAQTFFLMHNGARGPFLADSEVPSGYDQKPTALVAGYPYEFILDFYEKYTETVSTPADGGIGCTGKVWATIVDSGIARVELTTATVSVEASIDLPGYPGTQIFNRMYASIPVDAIPAEFIGPTRVRLMFEILAPSTAVVLYGCMLDVILTDDEGETANTVTITTANEAMSVGFIDATGALTACPGPKLWLADSSPYAITVTLPAYDAYAAQYLEIMAQSVGPPIVVQVASGVFLGTAATSFEIATPNEVHSLLAVHDHVRGILGWMHLNWRVTVR